jgi:uncharacterized protein YjbI with pentapeptide repeats
MTQRDAKPLPAIKHRWAGTEGQGLAREAVLRLLTGSKLDGLAWGQHQGRTDLRGIWLASARDLPGPRLAGALEGVPAASGVAWSGLDLSEPTFRIDLQDADVTDTVFDGVRWQGWRVRSSIIKGCSFTGADLRDAKFDDGNGGLPRDAVPYGPTTYQRCDFTKTRTGPYAGWGRAVFDHCTFSSTQFTSPQWFQGAELLSCAFRGQFREVIFGWAAPGDQPAPRISSVDVRDAIFKDRTLKVHRGSGLIEADDTKRWTNAR